MTGYKCMLKVILAQEGIKHGEFAKRININPGTLSAIVNNKQLPSFEVTYAICLELNRSIHEIWIKKEPTQNG
ncbi:helix-turn-helix transcriptional regulator [Geobacillus thermocatenulatus]|uniref:helix-turn-helix transcriptional regulator n=1 Tax=Geobacillus thermocatenulatus TaxID=33938 RepID=UPI0004743F8B|nr:helix-turn-helix transcriptional regulator [Geobacillus thermocatenulatus]